MMSVLCIFQFYVPGVSFLSIHTINSEWQYKDTELQVKRHIYCNIQKEFLIEAANQTGTLEDISLRKKQVGDTM